MRAARLLVLFIGFAIMTTAAGGPVFPQAKRPETTQTQKPATSAAEEILTNDSIIQLLKAGFDEDLIISKIQQSKHSFDLSVQGMIALKQAGVSDRLMHFMMDPTKPPEDKISTSSGGSPETPSTSFSSKEPSKTTEVADVSDPSLPDEIGVYIRREDKWAEIQPEVVNWKTGGWLKSVATAGIVKGDVNGWINGAHSRNAARSPMEFVIVAAEGVSITEFQLIHLREKSSSREFRTITGGVLHTSGGATRDLLQFEGNKIASRTFSVKLPTLGAGEYGFLPPTAQAGSGGSSAANLGKMYTFRVGE